MYNKGYHFSNIFQFNAIQMFIFHLFTNSSVLKKHYVTIFIFIYLFIYLFYFKVSCSIRKDFFLLKNISIKNRI